MIALVNAQSTTWHRRLPLSVMAIGAALEGRYPYAIYDGNVDPHLRDTLVRDIREKGIRIVGFTVMPGMQLAHSIRISQHIKTMFPDVVIVWGGYFPTLHSATVLASDYVDVVVMDQGDVAFPNLVACLLAGGDGSGIEGTAVRTNGRGTGARQQLLDPSSFAPLPYHRVDVEQYIERTCLGSRTINYHSSVGCPFLCGFCAVAASYQARWKGLPAERVAGDIASLQRRYAINAVEFHDNNFFTSEKRTHEFSLRMTGKEIAWWGEGRPDTLLAYDDATWKAMQRGGCAMIFFGAESSSEQTLALMDKGGTQTPGTVLDLAAKARAYGIIPEFSFVLGSPTGRVDEDLENDFRFIRQVKRINPAAEIILYVYSPVHFEQADLFKAAASHAFAYPTSLDDWLKPEWQMHDLRKNPVTPWLSARQITAIKNFERVLNARHPTRSDLKLTKLRRAILKTLGSWRYGLRIYGAPLEIRAAHHFMRYRQPEIEGF